MHRLSLLSCLPMRFWSASSSMYRKGTIVLFRRPYSSSAVATSFLRSRAWSLERKRDEVTHASFREPVTRNMAPSAWR
jgi:hypothetical protein